MVFKADFTVRSGNGEGMKRRNPEKLNNDGYALIMVVVVIAIVSILATTLLYLSGSNYIMKVNARQNTESFYKTETAMEELKAELVKQLSAATDKAYGQVLVTYASKDAYSRYTNYYSILFNELANEWKRAAGISVSDNEAERTAKYEAYLNGLVSSQYRGSIMLDTGIAGAGAINLGDTAKGIASVRGVSICYTDDRGYTTIISTDFLLQAPELNFGVDESVKTAPVNGAQDMVRTTAEMDKCVRYINWERR